MKKVLIIMTGGIIKDGISITQLEYMKHMSKDNLKIDILAVHNDDESMITSFKECNCNVIYMPSRVQHTIKYIICLFKLIKESGYSAIHVHGSSAMMGIELLTAKLLKVPVRIAHSRNTYTKHPRIDALFRPAFNHSYTIGLACGKDAGEFLFKKKDFYVFYNAKDFEKFSCDLEERKEIRAAYNLDGKIVLGFVGTLNEQKNPLFLVDLFSKVNRQKACYKLMIIGDGVLKKKVLDYAEQKECMNDIIFIGRSNNVNHLIQGCDLMLLPSLYEGLPNVVLEWQIAGVPSLISDKVTKECKQSELVRFLPIDKGTDIWVDTILEYGENNNAAAQSKKACDKMLKAGFEINKSCERLRSLYIKGVLPNE